MASSYRDTLDSSDRVRYDAKLSLIGNRDPWRMHSNSQTGLMMCHFCRRPRTSTSCFCRVHIQWRIYDHSKTLDPYNQFVCGWVRVREKQLCVKEDYPVSVYCVVTARVFKVKLCL